MLNGNSRLLRTPHPMSDESFWGYMTRLSEANGYPFSHWILNLAHLNLSHLLSRHSIVFQQNLDLSTLARLIGVDVSELLALTYPPAATTEQPSQPKHLFWGLPVRRQIISLQRSKICPACLRESNYCSRLWDLVPLTVCHLHKSLLIDTCPKCNKNITWTREHVCSCPCGFDWRDISSETLEDSELEVGRHIHNLCNRACDAHEESLTSKVAPLLRLSLDDSISALLFIAGQHVGSGAGTGRHVASLNRYSALHSLLTLAYSVFKNWPHNFHQFLEWRRSRQNQSTEGSGLERDFGRFHHLLHRFLSSSSFDFMRIAYDEYVKLNWIGGHTARSQFLKATNVRERYISMNKALIKLGVYSSTIVKLIENGKLHCIIKKSGKRKLYLIEVSSLEKVKPELSNRVTFSNAAKMLDITSEQVLELVRNGSLPPPHGPFVDGCTKRGFSRSTLETYLDSTKRSRPPHSS